MTTRLTDIIEPAKFTEYVTKQAMEKTNLVDSGLLVRNEVIQQQLAAGAHSFTVPHWNDLANTVPNVSDDSDNKSTPNKITAGKMVVRKSFINNSWSAANFASEIAGSSAEAAIQRRVTAYWNRHMQHRLVATMGGVLASNVLNNSGDMVLDISALTGNLSKFSASAVIDAAGTLGDSLGDITSLAVHGDVYRQLLKDDLIETVMDSNGTMRYQTYRGLMLIQDDGMPVADGVYTSALFGAGCFAFGIAAPTHADGTAIQQIEDAGMGGGQTVLHSRINVAMHPEGFTWNEAALTTESPTLADLALAKHYTRVIERKAVKLAFLKSKL